MSKTSKAYREAAEKVDKTKLYSPLEAAKLAKETSSKKQDATVEVAIRLGVDPARPIRWSAARSTCPTARVRPRASRCSQWGEGRAGQGSRCGHRRQ